MSSSIISVTSMPTWGGTVIDDEDVGSEMESTDVDFRPEVSSSPFVYVNQLVVIESDILPVDARSNSADVENCVADSPSIFEASEPGHDMNMNAARTEHMIAEQFNDRK